MAGNPPPPPDGMPDDFFDQIFAMPSSYSDASAASVGGTSGFSLGLSLDHHYHHHHRPKEDDEPSERVQLATLFPPYGYGQQIRSPHNSNPLPLPPPSSQVLHRQSMQPPPPRPRIRARRGQATDPHSIAERLRRERIAERIRALQELVPNTNKTDRAAMLDEIVEYVKFLRLQVKVLSMSRLGGAGAVAQLVADIPLSSVEGGVVEGRSSGQVWEQWSTDGTQRQVAKLMEDDIGAAMQFLQSKALCIMPISLVAAIYPSGNNPSGVKPEPDNPS